MTIESTRPPTGNANAQGSANTEQRTFRPYGTGLVKKELPDLSSDLPVKASGDVFHPASPSTASAAAVSAASAASTAASTVSTPESIAAKVERYLKAMTLEEKVGQMVQFGSWDNGDSPERDALVRDGRVGSFLNITGAEQANRYQRIAMEETRLGKLGLGIPLLFGIDVFDRGYRTIGPNSLGYAASFDPELVRTASRRAGFEARSAGVRFTCGPDADVSREPRWGRVMETYGESSKVASEMVRAGVEGFHDAGVAVTLKHFVGYGGVQGGREYQAVHASPQQVFDYYLPSFRAGIEAGADMVMPALSSLNGKPPHADHQLLHEVLEEGLGFKGVVLSDWGGIRQLINFGVLKGSTRDEQLEDAAVQAANAGVHIEMEGGPLHDHLAEKVRQGKVPLATVDEAVRRILTLKAKLGLFEKPYVAPGLEEKVTMTPENRAAAREAAARSMVLLRNENHLLPLAASAKKLAVVGPVSNHRDATLGVWHARGREDEVVTVLNGIRSAVAPGVEVLHQDGVDINSDRTDGIAAAVEAAKQSDVVVAVVGESHEMSGEAASRSNLKLPGKQEELLKALVATGKPVVAVLINGRPLEIPWLAQNVPAIVEAWQPGTEGGHAVADVLFGKVNPGGKLPMTFPKSVGQLSLHHDLQAIGRPVDAQDAEAKYSSRYLDIGNDPQYAFGHGLSYTTFGFENLELSSKTLTPDGKLKVRVTVKNTGDRRGDEVVQLYGRDEVAELARPLKELKAFQRVTLEPGERKTVELELDARDFAFTNERGQQLLEPGTLQLYAGPASDQLLLQGSVELVLPAGSSKYVHQLGGATGLTEAKALEAAEAALGQAQETLAAARANLPSDQELAEAQKALEASLEAFARVRGNVEARVDPGLEPRFQPYGSNGAPSRTPDNSATLRTGDGMDAPVAPLVSPAELAVRLARGKLNELNARRERLAQAQKAVEAAQQEWLKARARAEAAS